LGRGIHPTSHITPRQCETVSKKASATYSVNRRLYRTLAGMELRRVRHFLGLSQILVSVATGISVYRLAGAENGRLELNTSERRSLEQFYEEKLKILAEIKRNGGGE
jgi:hypothetical protein